MNLISLTIYTICVVEKKGQIFGDFNHLRTIVVPFNLKASPFQARLQMFFSQEIDEMGIFLTLS